MHFYKNTVQYNTRVNATNTVAEFGELETVDNCSEDADIARRPLRPSDECLLMSAALLRELLPPATLPRPVSLPRDVTLRAELMLPADAALRAEIF